MHSSLLSRRRMALLCASLALGLALAAAGTWTFRQLAAGQALCADTLRLHVRADSDSVLDQTLKLMVRDAVLELTENLYRNTASQQQALRCAAQNLLRIQLAAGRALARVGSSAAVRVSLVNMYFDAARYSGGSLPAGRYDAVRVELGDAAHTGKNWWCVLYPGLCRAACGGYAQPEENDLVCGDYILRFWVVDWWQRLTASREDQIFLALT